MAIDILLRLMGNGDSAKAAFKGVRDEAAKVEKAVDDIGKSDGLSHAEEKAKRYWQAVDAAADKTENLNRSLERNRNWGAGMALAGGAALVLSSRLVEVYKEGARADEKLTAMMQKRGEGGRLEEMTEWASKLADTAAMADDDPIKEAAAGLLGFGMNAKQIQEIMPGLIGQSRLYGQSLDSVAMAMGKAFGKGDVGALVKSGVLIDPAEVERIKEMTDHGEKQRAMFAAVKESMDKYALSITEGMSAAEMAANRAAKGIDDVETAIGKGSAAAQAGFSGMTASVLKFMGASESASYGVGWLLTTSGYAVTAAGSVLTLTSQIGLAKLGLASMGITGVASLGAIAKGAIAAGVAMLRAFAIPLAVLSAGLAVGMAGYELLRRSGVLGKNMPDAVTAVKGTVGEMLGMLSGGTDKAAADLEKRGAAITMPDTGSVVPSIAPVIDATDAKSTKGRRGADPIKAAAALARKAKAAEDKENKYRAKIADGVAQRASDIEVATMEELYATRIAQLEASKPKKGDSSAIDAAIEKLKAEQMVKEAQIRAKHSDSFAESGGLEIANIRARGLMQRAGIVRAGEGGNSIGMALSALRSGGGMAALGNGAGRSSSGGSGGSGGTVTARVASQGFDAVGNFIVQFEQLIIPPPRIARAANGLRN